MDMAYGGVVDKQSYGIGDFGEGLCPRDSALSSVLHKPPPPPHNLLLMDSSSGGGLGFTRAFKLLLKQFNLHSGNNFGLLSIRHQCRLWPHVQY